MALSISQGNTGFTPQAGFGPAGARGVSFFDAPRKDEITVGFPRSAEALPQRAGFGNDTLSISAAALKTISRTIRGAKELVPSLDELQQALRSRRAELAQQFSKSEQEPRTFPTAGQPRERQEILGAPQPVEPVGIAAAFQRPEPVPQLRTLFAEDAAVQSAFSVTSAPGASQPAQAVGLTGRVTTNSLDLLA